MKGIFLSVCSSSMYNTGLKPQVGYTASSVLSPKSCYNNFEELSPDVY